MTTSHPTVTASRTSPGSLSADDFHLSTKEADEYAVMQIRNAAFDAVHSLWRKRQAEGLTQQKLAEILERDKGWVSRALRGPANWEFKTFARLVRALRGEAEISVYPLELPAEEENYHAYRDNTVGEVLSRTTTFAESRPVPIGNQNGQVFVTSSVT
jgi:transcriptional regulator with XRE-family HTH domain